MSTFVWSRKRRTAAEMLADGYSINEVAQAVEVDGRSVRRWRADSTFSEEVDRLTLAAGVANRAERLRIIKKVVRSKQENGEYKTEKDLLDWMKLAQAETNNQGATYTLNLVGFDAALGTVYGNGDQSDSQPDESD